MKLLAAPLLSLILFFSWPAWAAKPGAAQNTPHAAEVELYFFWSLYCPHCLDARPFIESLPKRYPWIKLHSLELTQNPENVGRYLIMAERLGQEANAVPGFIFCGEMHVGWDTATTTGAFLVGRLEGCHRRLQTGQPTAASERPLALDLPLIGRLEPGRLSLPVFTLVIAGLDAFNPCAFFVLLFLLSLLVHQKSRARMLTTGGVFVFFSGIMYFAFMAAWLNVFRWFGELAWVTWGAGALAVAIALFNIKDFFVFGRGPTLSIPESRKPQIYQRARAILAAGSFPALLAATAALAVAANFYELLCTAGFPMVYTRVLTLQNLTPAGHYLYLALYNLVYVIPLMFIVAGFALSLGQRKLTERQGRLLKLLSGVMMLGLGVVLLTAPEALSHPGVSLGLLLAAIGVTVLAARLVPKG